MIGCRPGICSARAAASASSSVARIRGMACAQDAIMAGAAVCWTDVAPSPPCFMGCQMRSVCRSCGSRLNDQQIIFVGLFVEFFCDQGGDADGACRPGGCLLYTFDADDEQTC